MEKEEEREAEDTMMNEREQSIFLRQFISRFSQILLIPSFFPLLYFGQLREATGTREHQSRAEEGKSGQQSKMARALP